MTRTTAAADREKHMTDAKRADFCKERAKGDGAGCERDEGKGQEEKRQGSNGGKTRGSRSREGKEQESREGKTQESREGKGQEGKERKGQESSKERKDTGKSKVYGYIRVSTKEQNEDRQWIAMKESGVPFRNVYTDKQSGKDFDRPGYKKVLGKLRKGDTLVIKSLDRLGRNFDEILEQWRFITVEKEVGIIILDIPLLGDLNKDLMGRVVAQLMLTLMSYMAETERINIRKRQAEGIEAARLRGVRLGRKPKEVLPEFEEVYDRWTNGLCSARAAGRELGISSHTFAKWAAERNAQEDGGSRELRE